MTYLPVLDFPVCCVPLTDVICQTSSAIGWRCSSRYCGRPLGSWSARVHRVHVDQHLGQQPHALERRAVLRQGGLLLRAAVEEVEHRARQARARHAPQVLDVDGALQPGHGGKCTDRPRGA